MKYLVTFLSGVLLLLLVAATQLPKQVQSNDPIDGEVASCAEGLTIAIIYYEGRAEYYLEDGTLFALLVKDGDKTRFLIRTPDGVVHEYSSNAEVRAALGTPCEVAAKYPIKKQGLSV